MAASQVETNFVNFVFNIVWAQTAATDKVAGIFFEDRSILNFELLLILNLFFKPVHDILRCEYPCFRDMLRDGGIAPE